MRQIALLFLWSLAALAQTAKPEEISTIEGRVLNAATGEPVGKASLLLMRIDSTQGPFDWARSFAASSDSAGKFAIRNVDPGKYRLRATRNGFVVLEYGARSSQQFGTVLDLNSPQQLADVDFRLVPQGVIAGRVLDADGEPLQKAQVQLLRSRYINGKKALSTTGGAYTNDLGEYRCPGLTPGKYYLYAQNFEGLPPTSVAKEDYVPIYYPSALTSASAAPIDVAGGAEVRAGDMVLRKAPTASVKGRVVIDLPDAHGTPSVRFFPRIDHNNSSGESFRAYSARVDAKGEFEIRTLTPGSYTAMAEIAKGGRGFTGRTTVDVAGSNIEGLIVTIGSGVFMTGRIRVEGEATQDFKNPSVKLQQGGPTSTPLGWTYPIAQDHTFRFENLPPDLYGFLIEGLPDGFYTKSIRVGDADVLYSGVDLTSAASAPVNILLSPKAGLVTGGARNPNTNQPAQNATVVMVPNEKERIPISAFYPQSTSDQYGRFTFKNIVPGEYKVYAWEDVEASAWMDPDFMKPLEAKGQSVTVGESGQVSVQVDVIPADSQSPSLQ